MILSNILILVLDSLTKKTGLAYLNKFLSWLQAKISQHTYFVMALLKIRDGSLNSVRTNGNTKLSCPLKFCGACPTVFLVNDLSYLQTMRQVRKLQDIKIFPTLIPFTFLTREKSFANHTSRHLHQVIMCQAAERREDKWKTEWNRPFNSHGVWTLPYVLFIDFKRLRPQARPGPRLITLVGAPLEGVVVSAETVMEDTTWWQV